MANWVSNSKRQITSNASLAGRIFAVVFAVLLAAFTASCDRRNERDVRIELWTLALRPHFDSYMTELIAAFEQENPGVDVVWVDVPFDAMQRKFLAAAAAGQAPDVVNLSDGFYSRFVALGGVVDLSPFVPGSAHETYFEGALKLCTIDGKLYALPWYLTANVSFINTKLLANADTELLEFPNSWNGLRRTAGQYHDRTGQYLMSPQLGQESRLPLWFAADNLEPLRADAQGRYTSNLTDPRIVQLVQEWVDLYRQGALPAEAVVGDHGRMIDLYQNGRTAFMVTGPNFLSRIADAAPEVFANTEIRPSPVGADGKHEIATMLLCVTSQSKHPAEAANLAWFISNAKNQLAFAKIVNILPSTPASLNDPHFSKTDTKLDAARAISAASLKNATSHVPPLAVWPELTSVFQEQIKAVFLDGADVKTTLSAIDKEWNAILAEGQRR